MENWNPMIIPNVVGKGDMSSREFTILINKLIQQGNNNTEGISKVKAALTKEQQDVEGEI